MPPSGWRHESPAGRVFAPLPRLAVEAFTGRADDPARFVVHLPVIAADLAGALDVADAVVRALAPLPEVDGAGATVSAEDAQHVRHWVFCDRIMPDRRRCRLRADHREPCAPG